MNGKASGRAALFAAAAAAVFPTCSKPQPAAAAATPLPPPPPPSSVGGSGTAVAKSAPVDEVLPPPARAVPPAELAGDFRCGPFRTKDLEKGDRPLLRNRMRVRFLPGGELSGGDESAKIEVEKQGVTMFIGARELFQRGDEQFPRRAAKTALFDGGYEAVSLRGRDGPLEIVTGLYKDEKSERDLIAVAHGWFLDPNRDVLDVAFFVSRSALQKDLAQCRLFAQKVLTTVAAGPRALTWNSDKDKEIETQVSYAKFHYKLPPDWMLASSMGIHDFARVHFRRRGVFPAGGVNLELALDSHPGDWATPGTEEGQRKGKLLGIPVTWHFTKGPSTPALLGAWTVSTEVKSRDHAVAAIQTLIAAELEEALRFAESIRVGP